MSEYIVTINDKKRRLVLLDGQKVSLDGSNFDYELTKLNDHTYLLKIDNKVFQVSAEMINSESFSVFLYGRNIETTVRSALQEKAIKILEKKASLSHKTEVKAPMPGMILKIKKNIGQEVTLGDSVIILEAMKMENDLRSPASGIIKNLSVKEGSTVEKGAVLFSIE